METKVKICGITQCSEVQYLNKVHPDYMGMVLYFPKSKRNISLEQAAALCEQAEEPVKKVAVTVSPDQEQVRAIGKAGFDYLQVHGALTEDVLQQSPIPVIRAFQGVDTEEIRRLCARPEIYGFLFDAAQPGSGKVFDWNTLREIRKDTGDKKVFLAGGLTPENVGEAVRVVRPDVVDVSSGVENASGQGKDVEKIREFIEHVGHALS